MDDAVAERDELDPIWEILEWRYDQARRLGVPAANATEFAESAGDTDQLRRLVNEQGCPPDTAARIVT
jgi:hypothetical protein